MPAITKTKNHSLILDAFNKLGIKSHKIINSKQITCFTILDNYTRKETALYYQKIKKFVKNINQWSEFVHCSTMIHDTAIKKIFKKSCGCFKIYYENEIKSFYAVDYIEDFCQNSLENILSAFDFLNGIHVYNKIVSKIGDTIFNDDQLTKIFNIHLVMILVRIFCIFAESEKISSECGYVAHLLMNRDKYLSYLKKITVSKKKFIMEKTPDNDTKIACGVYKLLVPVHNYFADSFNIFFSKNDEELKKYIKENNELTIIFNHFIKPGGKFNRIDISKKYLLEINLFFLTQLIDQIENKKPDRISLQIPYADIPKYLIIEV